MALEPDRLFRGMGNVDSASVWPKELSQSSSRVVMMVVVMAAGDPTSLSTRHDWREDCLLRICQPSALLQCIKVKEVDENLGWRGVNG